MKIQFGNIWSAWETADLFLFTSNGVLKRNGELVMGAGIARQVRDRFNNQRLPLIIGRSIAALANTEPELYDFRQNAYKYGLLVSTRWPKAKLGAFQTKMNWKKKSPLPLIQFSTNKLIEWTKENPKAEVHLTMPGCGHGGLSQSEVLPLIEKLPDTVNVWSYK